MYAVFRAMSPTVTIAGRSGTASFIQRVVININEVVKHDQQSFRCAKKLDFCSHNS